jgi:hypothetical protein
LDLLEKHDAVVFVSSRGPDTVDVLTNALRHFCGELPEGKGVKSMPLEEAIFRSGHESEFEEFLVEHFSVFPVQEITPGATVAVPIARQMVMEVGKPDLLFLDDLGKLYLIDCKLVKNPEQRREVVAQLLEYRSRLQGRWGAREIFREGDAFAQKHGYGRNWFALFEKAFRSAGKDVPPQEELEKRVQRVKRTDDSSIVSVIAANRFQQRAMVLAHYLEKHKVPIACVEVRRYRSNGRYEALSFVRSASLLSTLTESQRSKLNAEEWVAWIETTTHAVVAKWFLEWAQEREKEGLCRLRFGTTALMVEIKAKNGKWFKLFDVGENRIWIQLWSLQQGFSWGETRIQVLRAAIERATQAALPPESVEYPATHLRHLEDPARREALGAVLMDVIQQVR